MRINSDPKSWRFLSRLSVALYGKTEGETMSNQKNIIFGTGPLGLWVMQTLAEKGAQVTLVNRKGKTEQKLPELVEIVAGDATDSSIVHQICKEADAVFHCAMPPYTEWPDKFPPLTKGILEGVSRAGAKLIYGDNLYMYGDTEGRSISENLPYAATGHKGKVRAEMAEMLLNAHKKEEVQVVIGRGSDFYGPQVVNSAFGEMFFKAALSGKPANLLGNIDLPHTYTYIKDFSKALVKLSENDKALGQIWHIPNATTMTTRQLVELVEKEMMYEWEHPYIVDHSKFEQTLGADVTPHEVAIKETIAWYRQRIASN
jgi:nucleoside-diphosphate-sugar epimerase